MNKEWFKTRMIDAFVNQAEDMLPLLAERNRKKIINKMVYAQESIYYSEEFGLKITLSPFKKENGWGIQLNFDDAEGSKVQDAWMTHRDLTDEGLELRGFIQEEIAFDNDIIYFRIRSHRYLFEDSVLRKESATPYHFSFDFKTKEFDGLPNIENVLNSIRKSRNRSKDCTYIDAMDNDLLHQNLAKVSVDSLSELEKGFLSYQFEMMDPSTEISGVSRVIEYLYKEYVKKP